MFIVWVVIVFTLLKAFTSHAKYNWAAPFKSERFFMEMFLSLKTTIKLKSARRTSVIIKTARSFDFRPFHFEKIQINATTTPIMINITQNCMERTGKRNIKIFLFVSEP
jgi:hypothetical protein